MGMMVDLAADLLFRAVPWNEAAPGFNTSSLASDEERIRRQCTKPHLLFAGSHEGRGCGFQFGGAQPYVLTLMNAPSASDHSTSSLRSCERSGRACTRSRGLPVGAETRRPLRNTIVH